VSSVFPVSSRSGASGLQIGLRPAGTLTAPEAANHIFRVVYFACLDSTSHLLSGQGRSTHIPGHGNLRRDRPHLAGNGPRPVRAGTDAARPQGKRRRCAIGQCCRATLSARSRADARDTLRAAYTCAVEEELLSRNPVAVIRLPAPRTHKRRWWTVDDARRFLESVRSAGEPLYAAFVLILVLGLRKGEVLGLTWRLVDLDAAELYVGEQVHRVGRELIRRQVKTETSEAPLPLPELCVAALKLRREQQEVDRSRADGAWIDTGLVFTTRYGTALEPRNFNRSFDRCIIKAQVPRITVHGTRKTCGSLLAALDVHPRVVMQILRHSKIAVTMEIYTEVPSAATRDALKKLGPWLGAALLYFSVVRASKTASRMIATGR
jgi:integrase